MPSESFFRCSHLKIPWLFREFENNKFMDENEKDEFEVRHVVLTSRVFMDAPPPPPPDDFVSPFKTIQEWLTDICDSKEPDKTIEDLQISLSESPTRAILCLEGYNTEIIDHNTTAHRITFIPPNGDFPLPEDDYGPLSKQQVQDRVLNEVVEFSKTEKFQNSFLWQAKYIVINFVDAPSVRLK